jgi:hypothetical protein
LNDGVETVQKKEQATGLLSFFLSQIRKAWCFSS